MDTRPDSIDAAFAAFDQTITAEQAAARKAEQEARDSILKTLAANNSSYAAIAEGGAKSKEEAQAEVIQRQLVAATPAIVQKLAVMAVSGDVAAARAILDRVLPALRPTEATTPIQLNGEDRAEAIYRAITEGRIGVETGSKLLASIAAIEEARLNANFAARIEALEARVAQSQQPAPSGNVIRIPARPA